MSTKALLQCISTSFAVIRQKREARTHEGKGTFRKYQGSLHSDLKKAECDDRRAYSKDCGKVQAFRGGELDKIDEVEFAKVATLEEIAKNGYVLTPGRYVGVKLDLDDESFDEKMRVYDKELSKLLKEEKELKTKIKEVFDTLGYEMEV